MTKRAAVVYLVKITNKRGMYLFKYGYTAIGIPARFYSEISCGFDVEVLEETCYESQGQARSAEQDKLSGVERYIVFAKFLISGGDTELFLTNPLTGEESSNPPPGKLAEPMRRPARKQRGITHPWHPGRYTPSGVIANGRWD